MHRSRFRLLALALVLAAAAAVHACTREAPEASGERVYSVQLHLHGSASEGEGSLDSHGWEASDVGCDVLWWSDHDFRLTTFEHVSRLGFEGWEEPLGRNEPWTVRLRKYRGDGKRVQLLARPEGASARFVAEPVREGTKSLQLAAGSSSGEFEPLTVVLGADRKLLRRSLATGVTLHLALFPEELGRDARAVVELTLSEHAPRAGLGLEPRSLRYEIAPSPRAAARAGARFVVPVACEPGRWNELALPVTADAVRGFPESPGEDNALYRIALGLETRNGARASACFDDLRIEQARSGPPMVARQRELIAEVGASYPALVQLQGLEVSYDSRHLNLFCEETPLPDYDALARQVPRDPEAPELLDQRAFRDAVAEWVVRETHARGGLVSYNHPFGATFEEGEKPRTNEEQLAILLRDRAAGADLLEVGYRDRGGATLDDHLWLWDRAALAGLRLVGVGTSDSHGGPDNRWRGCANNFVTWIRARSSAKRDLIAALRAGRAFFGDLERFDGELDLVLDSGERMGATVVTEARAVEVELVASGLRGGEELVVVESGARTARYPAGGPDVAQRHRLELPADGPAFVRFEVHDSTGPIALSNPLHFLRPAESGR